MVLNSCEALHAGIACRRCMQQTDAGRGWTGGSGWSGALHAADGRCAGVGKDGFFVPGAAGMRHCMQQTESNARGGNQPVEEGILLA